MAAPYENLIEMKQKEIEELIKATNSRKALGLTNPTFKNLTKEAIKRLTDNANCIIKL